MGFAGMIKILLRCPGGGPSAAIRRSPVAGALKIIVLLEGKNHGAAENKCWEKRRAILV